jgi:hypothetical protein
MHTHRFDQIGYASICRLRHLSYKTIFAFSLRIISASIYKGNNQEQLYSLKVTRQKNCTRQIKKTLIRFHFIRCCYKEKTYKCVIRGNFSKCLWV